MGVDTYRKEMVEFAQDLVRIDSADKNETLVNRLIMKKLKEHGIRSKLVGKEKDRKNLVAELRGSGRKSILLCGHADTVPAGDFKKWKFGPLSGKLSNGRIYGRGAADMKGGLASLVFSMIAVKECESELNGSLRLLVTHNEENGFGGINEMIETVSADACIVAEPVRAIHPEYRLSIGSRGVYRFELVTKGRTAHSGDSRNRGINAVTKMAKALLALEKAEFRYKKHTLFPAPQITPTVVNGGVAINIVPDECRALVDCRLSYGQDDNTVLEDVEAAIRKTNDNDMRWTTNEMMYAPVSFCREDSEIVGLLKANFMDVAEVQTSTQIAAYASDANMLNHKGVPTVMVGPKGDNMHSEDEFVDVQSMVDVTNVFTVTIKDFLRTKQQ